MTQQFIKNESDYVALFNYLNKIKSIDQETLFKHFGKKATKKEPLKYRWNYVEDKKYPCSGTRAAILAALTDKNEEKHITDKLIFKIWHLLYSISSQEEIDKALDINKPLSERKGIFKELSEQFSDATIEKFKKIHLEEKEYGSYSKKAIQKLLPLMRCGEKWNADNIDKNTLERIQKFITGEADDNIPNQIREKVQSLKKIEDYQRLPLWLACYIVYNRHSETSDNSKWESPNDIDEYLKDFKQHSLRNPIVEQIVTETLRTVRDIWKQYGHIDEIHLEMSREMKNPAKERERITKNNIENENTNIRIKKILYALKNDSSINGDIYPHSIHQQDILKIYEEYALNNHEMDAETSAIFKRLHETNENNQPTSSEIIKYRCWLEQKYKSPYTGRIIPLSELFTDKYQIEHIIPQSRYFDNSLSNKVICESEVNKLKDNLLGHEFIVKHHGEIVKLSDNKNVKIFSIEEYEDFIKKHYSGREFNTKRKKLLLDEIPDNFINRQLNDTRYISKFVKGLLSNIVRVKDENGEYEQESTSKNLIVCNGTITNRLKKDWGMNDVWNKIVLPRFERMNEIDTDHIFTEINQEGHKIPCMPIEFQKGFNKKRIDHRHHAMDALVIACTTREHVNLLNNESAKPEQQPMKYALSHKLRRYEEEIINGENRNVPKEFLKPWETFPVDAYQALDNIVISFKQNLRVINKSSNYYQHFENGKKVFAKQTKGYNWTIRKSMHKGTVFGEVNLQFTKEISINNAIKNPNAIADKKLRNKILELKQKNYTDKQIKQYFENKTEWEYIDFSKIKINYYSNDEKYCKDKYYATRKDLINHFSGCKKLDDAHKQIEKITDQNIQKILTKFLKSKDNDYAIAFSPEGFEEMNRNISLYNNNIPHKPIRRVRIYEKANKFCIGQLGNKNKKFVEADKGTNLFFAVYEFEKNGENYRNYVTIPLDLAIECQKQAQKEWIKALDKSIKSENEEFINGKLLFILSPNDLVYVPTEDEIASGIKDIDTERIYKFVSCTRKEAHFIPMQIAQPIIDTKELGSNNKSERAWTTDRDIIKTICIPLSVDRLGNVKIKILS